MAAAVREGTDAGVCQPIPEPGRRPAPGEYGLLRSNTPTPGAGRQLRTGFGARQVTLNAAYATHPERFARRPVPPKIPSSPGSTNPNQNYRTPDHRTVSLDLTDTGWPTWHFMVFEVGSGSATSI